MRDSYLQFFSDIGITKKQFFEFGLRETIYAREDKVHQSWLELKYRVENNQKVFIRGFGRDANGTHLFQNLYAEVLNNHQVTKDSTNNAEPTKLIRDLTGYSKTANKKYELLRNYQISHVFGRTKNVYAFTAPWNIVYVPKLIDPFTGHEAKGEIVEEYTRAFQLVVFNRFERYINEYNEIMSSVKFKDALQTHLNTLVTSHEVDEKTVQKMSKAVSEEFSVIEV